MDATCVSRATASSSRTTRSKPSKLPLSKSSRLMSSKKSKFGSASSGASWSAGTLLWARMVGYCAWPAVSTPPPSSSCTWRIGSKGRVEHHVHFLGYDNLRGWVHDKDAFVFDPDIDPCGSYNWSKKSKKSRTDLQRHYTEARMVADLVQEMSCSDRLKMLGYHHLYELDESSGPGKSGDWACVKREGIKVENGFGEEIKDISQLKHCYDSENDLKYGIGLEKKGVIERKSEYGGCKRDYEANDKFNLTKFEGRESLKRDNDSSEEGAFASDSDESLRLFLEPDSDDTDDVSQGSIEEQGLSKNDDQEIQDTESKTMSKRANEKHYLKKIMYRLPANGVPANGVLPIRPGELCWTLLCRALWWPCILSLPAHGGAKVIEADVVYYHVHFLGKRRGKSKWATQLRLFEDKPSYHARSSKKAKDTLLQAIREAESVQEWSCEQRHLHYVGKSAVKKRKIEVDEAHVDLEFNDYGFPHGEVYASLLPSDWKLCQGVIWTPHGRTFISLKTAVLFLMKQISRTTSLRVPLKRSISTPCLSRKHPSSLSRGVEGDQSSFILGQLHQSGRLKVQEKRVNLCGELATERVRLYHDPFMPKNWNVELVRSPAHSNKPEVFYILHGTDHLFNNRRDFLQSQICQLKTSESVFSRLILDLEHVICLYALKEAFAKWLCNQKTCSLKVVRLPDVFIGHESVITVEEGDETFFLDADTREFVARKVNFHN